MTISIEWVYIANSEYMSVQLAYLLPLPPGQSQPHNNIHSLIGVVHACN